MLSYFADRPGKSTVPLTPVTSAGLQAWLKKQPARTKKWVATLGFKGDPGSYCLLPEATGDLGRVLVGTGSNPSPWDWGDLARGLPLGRYSLDASGRDLANAAALGWALGTYRFTAYKTPTSELSTLVWPKDCDRPRVEREVSSIFLVRDLVNTPAEDMGPEELASAARKVMEEHGGETLVLVDDALIKKNYPAIYDVGRASERRPRLIDLRWGEKGWRRVTLVGKGVCFDTGGLDLKSAQNMLLMKKDMGGAAHVLALARMIMMARLPIRLRVLIPAVENSVSGGAIRPGDVIQTRKGLTVEVGNTDAEGRIILCDALAEADSEEPDVIIDFATLTGAARTAMGTELPVLFCNDDDIAAQLLDVGRRTEDPMWRMPLYQPYKRYIKSPIADLNNVAAHGYAGAIVAALYLEQFVTRPWVHLDLMGWNVDSRPGRPMGGEAQCLRTVFAWLEERYRRPAASKP